MSETRDLVYELDGLAIGMAANSVGRRTVSDAARALEAKDAEITKLKSQLEEARAKAIEECIAIADAELADPKSSGRRIAKLLRALNGSAK